PDGNDVLAQQSDERDPVVVIDVGVPVQLLLGNARMRREVPQIPGSDRQPVMERDDRVGILRSDRPQVQRAAVGRYDIGLPVRRVGRRLPSGHDRKLFVGCRRSDGCIARRTRRPYPWVWTTRTTPRGAIWARQTLGELSVVTARPAPALAEAGRADLRTGRRCRLVP